jgi:hypothetical protein
MEPQITNIQAISRSRRGLVILTAILCALAVARVLAFRENTIDFAATVNLPIEHLTEKLKPERVSETSYVIGSITFDNAASCNIEHINGTNFNTRAALNRLDGIAIDGWVADLRKRSAAKTSWIELISADNQHDYLVPIQFRIRRADVQEVLHGRASYGMAGFMSEIDTSNLPKGDYHMLVVYKSGGSYHRCDNGRHILLQDDAAN